MLVQLSPWQSVKTSLTVAKARRGSKSSKRSDSQHHGDAMSSVVASFVPPVRRSSKRKKNPASLHSREEMIPSLAITSAHRVNVLGRRIKSHADDDQDAPPLLQESTQWQYSSRPGRASSFLQESLVNGNSRKRHYPAVPAIMDAKNNRVYALQNENATLCCWDATKASGPDDTESSTIIKISLTTPALSLALHNFRKGIVYGTCVDGSVFVGSWICNQAGRPETLQVDYLEASQSKGEHHVFTTATTELVVNRNAGQKRKANEGNDSTVAVHQMFLSEGGRLRLLKHELSLPPDNEEGAMILSGNANQIFQEALIELLSNGKTNEERSSLDSQSTIACPMDNKTVALMYHSGSRDALWNCYCAHICLETGRLKRSPFVLPPATKQLGALSPSLLVVGTTEHLMFCDLMHGSIVHCVPVSPTIGVETGAWNLATDRKSRRVVIIFQEGDRIKASTATATLDGAMSQPSTLAVSSTLAEGLRSSLTTSFPSAPQRPCITRKNLMDIGEPRVSTDHGVDKTKNNLSEAIDQALKRLGACRHRILDPGTARLEPEYFLNEYETALVTVLAAVGTPRIEGMETAEPPLSLKQDVADNPQDAIRSSSGSNSNANHFKTLKPVNSNKEGAIHENGCRGGKMLNGIKVNSLNERVGAVRAYTPSSIPQRFIDGATSIVLSTLQLPRVEDKLIRQRVQSARDDARLILSRLIHSGKVSSRLHFESNAKKSEGLDDTESEASSGNYFLAVLRSVKLTKKRRRVFSPVDLMHDMLSCCPDVSERILVTMVDYMLCRALPEDVAENLIESHSLHHPDSILSKRYFNTRTRLLRTSSQNVTNEKSSNIIQQLQTEVDELANKVLRAGAVFLVSCVTSYSRCNETLLRSALLEGLTMKHEPALLAYILADLLSVTGRDAVYVRDRRYRYQKMQISCAAITQWIAALCDTYRDRLQELPADKAATVEHSLIEYVHCAVNAALEQTEAIMSLRDAFEHSTEEIYSQFVNEDERNVPDLLEPKRSEKNDTLAIPPYSIERLVF